jgi:hypothetical protein
VLDAVSTHEACGVVYDLVEVFRHLARA